MFLFSLIFKVVTGESTSNGRIQVYDACKNLIYTFTAHDNSINQIKLLSNGNLASCSSDKTIKIWNTSTWTLIRTLFNHTDTVTNLDQIDENTLVSVSLDQTLRVWNMSSGAQLYQYTKGFSLWSVKLLSNGYLAVGLNTGIENLLIFNYTEGSNSVKYLKGHTGTVFDIEVLDSQYLASASGDRSILVWDLNWTNGSFKFNLSSHKNIVVDLALISSTTWLASASEDLSIKIWDWNNGQLLFTLTGHTNIMWKGLDMYSTGVLASGSLDFTIKFWNVTNGYLVQSLYSNLNISALTIIHKQSKSFKIVLN